MSIDDLKKKAKLSLDEMYNNKTVGNPDGHKNGRKLERTNEEPITHPDEKMTAKVTFNTSESKLDRFNGIYARRILEKRKTDKSALWNEALDLLLEKEEKENERM